jgi:hypothetical protein
MTKCVVKGFNFLFTLSNLAIKFITIPLKFFFFLGGLNNEVSLGVLASGVFFAGGALVALAKALVFNSKVLDETLLHGQLNRYLMAFSISSLHFWNEDILVNLNFLLTLFHRHLELVLAVFKPVNLISLHVDGVTELFDFEFHNVVLHESFFLLVGYFSKFNSKHFIFHQDVLEGGGEGVLLRFDLSDGPLNVAALILKFLVWSD